MIIGALVVQLHLPGVHSLKEKRMIIKSMTARIRRTFNVSVAEIEEQDIHQVAVLGIVCVAACTAQADSVMDQVLELCDREEEAVVTSVDRAHR